MSAVIPLHRCRPLEPGDRVGSFVLREPLGAGGMGEVFLAEHESLGRTVAIKVMHAEHRHNARMHERFAREARIAGRVVHENVVAVTELHELPDGRPYMVMEHVDGVDVCSVRRARAVAGAVHRARHADRRRARGRPSRRRGAPRSQARQHPGHRRRAHQAARLRRRAHAARRERSVDADGPGDGDAELHVARAGDGRAGRSSAAISTRSA